MTRFLERLKYNFQKQGVLTQIIIINVAVFLILNISKHVIRIEGLETYLALPIGGYEFIFQFWTLFTYMFTHEGLGHVFWNMFLLYFTAQIFFTILGQKKLLYVYFVSGICGGALVVFLGMVFPEAFGNSILLGASAAVLGVAAVMAVYAPNYTVYLWGVIELRYKYFFLLIFGVSTIIDLSVNTGGKISHIGGALFGLLYGYQLKKGNDILNFSFLKKKKTKLKVVSRNTTVADTKMANEEMTMNMLLDKIGKSGYDSLTKAEKDLLFKLSQKK